MIYLRNQTRRYRIDARRLERTAESLLDALGESGSSVAILLAGDRAIRSLNAAHRGKDRATDVLSFPLVEPAAKGARRSRRGGGPERMLGDIVISLDTANRQSREYNVSLVREVERLLIHGLLHLLGYDHEQPAARRRMASEEKRLAGAIGMPWPEGYRSGL